MYTWNPLVSTIALYTIHWEAIFSMSLLPILNGFKAIKDEKDEKDDNKDAKWIADLFKFCIVKASNISEKDGNFTCYQYKIVNIRSSEKNHFQNALTVGNCKIDLIFLMSLVNLLPLLSILFYQMNLILVKTFFLKFTADVNLLLKIFSVLLKELIWIIIRKLELELSKSIWNILILFLLRSSSTLTWWFLHMKTIFSFFVLFPVLTENPQLSSFQSWVLMLLSGQVPANLLRGLDSNLVVTSLLSKIKSAATMQINSAEFAKDEVKTCHHRHCQKDTCSHLSYS